ncbi:MAG: nucleotidyltransferase family protein [Solirubrobacteraceae bacterium]
MLPLLHHSLKEAALPSATKSLLRAARAYEEMRAARYHEALIEVLEALLAAGVHPVVLPGAGLVERAYGDWALRHSHDLDLLATQKEWKAVRCALAKCCVELHSAPGRQSDGLDGRHWTGLPVCVHSRLLRNRYYGCTAEEAVGTTEETTVAGVSARVLRPGAAASYVLGQAGAASPRSLRWAADIWHLSRCDDFDWEEARTHISRLRVSLPAAVLLGFMASALGLEHLDAALPGIHADAVGLGRAGEDAALADAVGSGALGVLGALQRPARTRDRTLLAARLLAPSWEYLRAVEPPPVSLAYARRTARYALGALRR